VGSGGAELWDLSGRPSLLRRLNVNDQGETQVAFVSEGALLTRMSGRVRRWDVASGEVVASFASFAEPVTSLAVAASTIVVRSRTYLTLLDPIELREIRRVAIPAETGPAIASDAAGVHILCSRKNELLLIDWSLPAVLRSARDDETLLSWPSIVGASPVGSEVPLPHGGAATSAEYAYALWAAGNVVKAHDIFTDCDGISEYTRSLVLRATKNSK